jgi:hypothetical protein
MPVDAVFSQVQQAVTDANFERLAVTHPADDDNVWWIWIGPGPRDIGQRSVQIDTAPGGTPPFLVEGDGEGQWLQTSDAAEAGAAVIRWL